MDNVVNHISNSVKNLRLLLANILLQDMVDNCVWADEFFADCDVEAIESSVANYTSAYFSTTTVYGFSYGPNIDKIIDSFSLTEIKNISLKDIRAAKNSVLSTQRIFRLNNVSGVLSSYTRQQQGYCILSGKKILAAEVGIEVQDNSNFLREISSLKGEILQQKSKILELESEVEFSRSTLQDKEAALAGRANLTWS